MAYLKFNKDELVNLEYSLKREVLATNRAGGYMSSTIIGCNTRKYHGLLILPIEEFDGENHVLLSNLDETSSSMDVSLIWVSISIRVIMNPGDINILSISSTNRYLP